MSSLIAKNIQIGADTTATNNFTVYQPATPNGTLLIGNGNTGITSSLVTLTSAGNVGIGTSAPSEKLAVAGNIKLGISGTSFIYGPSTTGRSVYSNSDTTAYITAYGSAYGSGLSSAFQFVTGTTKVTTLDSSGNLGLGVTPSAWSLGKSIEIAVAGAGMLGNGNQLTISKNAYFNAGWKYARTGDNALQYDLNGSTHAWFTAPSGTAGNAITFTQAMTLSAAGVLLVGTTSLPAGNGTALSLSGSSAVARIYGTTEGTGPLWVEKSSSTTSSAQVFIQFTVSGQANGNGQINGNGPNSAAFASFSDARLKENIVDLSPQLSNIMALRPVEFDYIESEGGGHQTGFIAQDMETVFPDAVGERADGMKTVTGWSKTEARLIKAIQEQQAIITALQADVAALKAAA